MEKQWFTLNEDTFLWLKDDHGLAYNAENKKQSVFFLSDRIEKKCNQLLNIENLYTTEITEEELNDKDINQWIQSLIDINAGYLTYNVAFENRPVSLKPILKIQDKKAHYELKHTEGIRGEVLQNLHELTFYLNGSVHGSNDYFKQTICPLKDCLVLDSSKVLSFISNSRSPFLSNINLVGNLFSYPDFERLINDISDYSVQCIIYIMVQDILDNMQKIKEINRPDLIRFNMLIDSSFEIQYLQDIALPFSITAFVYSENDFMHFSNMFEAFSAEQHTRFIPLYNKENLPFFESNIFVDKEELDTIELSKNEIFMRQALNTGDFGKLTIMPDGNVYANVNATALGTIDDSPYSIVYKEFMNGQSWLKVRDQTPCDDCIYQWLCPSPSNYETLIGQPNLCHVK